MKTLKKFDFVGRAGTSVYDWDAILSGDIVQLEEGEGKDYTCNVSTLRYLAAKQARKRGKTVRTNSVEGGVVLQAQPASKEQLAAWKKEDAESSNGEGEGS